ncbi:glycoside hydrolase family 13 protein [Suillus clintonianus]|uniref:glycoside hydrolase family 13 protein n=1 Tax=Suillus clintonianus TaxID=1904413 RepID=UPI001B861D15|nr:glycoside hydrolase family 13 protein [Suillus clintonianus]KAG2147559.1 glycoside hydrolase family 13 protein [Suillus clintonianus]
MSFVCSSMSLICRQFRYWLNFLLLKWVPPSLPSMQLGPDGSSQNPAMVQFFTWDARHKDMSWWEHFTKEVPHLAALGFTQIWLPPPNKAMEQTGRGYDAYDLWDLGEFDQKGSVATRWGTKEEFLRACNAARQCGMNVIIDAVLNHKLGADRMETFRAVRVDPLNRLKDIENERSVKGWTAFDFPGRLGKYSSMQWNFNHFTGLDWDELTRTNGVFRISSERHKGWSKWVDSENGNYDYLLGIDIDHRHPEVRNDLFSWGSWVLDTTGACGFRLDAIKHMDRRFLLEFIQRTRKLPGRERLFAVSEYWSANLQLLIPYIRAFHGQTSFFDVPLHENFHRASKTGASYDLRTILEGSLVKLRPGDAVTFVDNHDTQVGQSLESWVDTNFKAQAYAIILLRCHGYPCVFYGDLYPNDECFDEGTSRILKQLLLARKSFAYGPMVDYFDHRNCIGFVRMGDSDHAGCAVVLSNIPMPDLTTSKVRMNVGPHHGTTFRSLFDGTRTVAIDRDGWGAFPSSEDCVEVWVKTGER